MGAVKLVLVIAAVVGLVVVATLTWRSRAQAKDNDSTKSTNEYSWMLRSSIGRSLTESSLAKELAVFKRARSSDDDIPRSVSETIRRLTEESNVGEPRFTRGRLLLRDGADSRLSLYAVPTSRGWVCYATMSGLGHCLSELSGQASLTVQGRREKPTVVHGLLANDVADVEVIVEGHDPVPAIVGENAFYREISGLTPREVLGVRLFLTDGRSEEYRLR